MKFYKILILEFINRNPIRSSMILLLSIIPIFGFHIIIISSLILLMIFTITFEEYSFNFRDCKLEAYYRTLEISEENDQIIIHIENRIIFKIESKSLYLIHCRLNLPEKMGKDFTERVRRNHIFLNEYYNINSAIYRFMDSKENLEVWNGTKQEKRDKFLKELLND